MDKEESFSKYISIIYRLGSRFFDVQFAKDQTGYGQLFFLKRIDSGQGIQMCQLAQQGSFDKGTVTKAIQRLEERQMITVEIDERDRRVRRLYTTPKAKPVLEKLDAAKKEWTEILTRGMNGQQKEWTEICLKQMAENACLWTNRRGEE